MSRFGLPGLWELITPSSNLWFGWGLKQTCSSPQDLSNNIKNISRRGVLTPEIELWNFGSPKGWNIPIRNKYKNFKSHVQVTMPLVNSAWNKLKILNEKIPLFPLINKFERKLANVLCLKAGECMGVCLDNLLVCN